MLFHATTLTALVSAALAAQADQPYSWKVERLNAGCQSASDCRYSFTVSGGQTEDVPAFAFHCQARTMGSDSTYRTCEKVGLLKRQSGPKRIEKAEAFVSLKVDAQPSENALFIQITSNNGNGVVTLWQAYENSQPYSFYADSKASFELIPEPVSSVAA